MDDQIVITIVYNPASRKPAVIVGTTSGDPQINIKDVLLALHASLGLYLEGLQGRPPAVQEADSPMSD